MRQNNKWMIPAVCSGVALLVSLAAGAAGKEEYWDE